MYICHSGSDSEPAIVMVVMTLPLPSDDLGLFLSTSLPTRRSIKTKLSHFKVEIND